MATGREDDVTDATPIKHSRMPSNKDAELSLVSGLISGMAMPSDAAEIYARISVDAFTSASLAASYEAARHLFSESGAAPEAEMVIERLKATDKLGLAGGRERVLLLGDLAATAANIRTWSKLVEEAYRRRMLIRATHGAAAKAVDVAEPFTAIMDDLGSELTAIASARDDLAIITIGQVMTEEFRALQKAYESPNDDHEVRTGFTELDDILGGLTRSELSVLAGRPAMGKTSLALAFAINASEDGRHVLFFSLEMSKRQLGHRLICMRSRVLSQELRKPKTIRDSSWSQISNAMSSLHKSRMAIVDAPSLSVMDIRAAARTCKGKHGLDLVCVDYLQLIRPVEKGHSREREVAEISSSLKSISRELDVPVLCLAQLNRANEAQADKVPRLNNLRESGAIEQDSDVVMFIHRPSYYSSKDADGNLIDPALAEIYVAKDRNGPCGRVEVGWDAPRTLFFDKHPKAAPPQDWSEPQKEESNG